MPLGSRCQPQRFIAPQHCHHSVTSFPRRHHIHLGNPTRYRNIPLHGYQLHLIPRCHRHHLGNQCTLPRINLLLWPRSINACVKANQWLNPLRASLATSAKPTQEIGQPALPLHLISHTTISNRNRYFLQFSNSCKYKIFSNFPTAVNIKIARIRLSNIMYLFNL